MVVVLIITLPPIILVAPSSSDHLKGIKEAFVRLCSLMATFIGHQRAASQILYLMLSAVASTTAASAA